MEDSSPHIAILPSPGMGHLIPIVELSKRLVENHRFSITLIITTTGSSPPSKAQHSVLESLPNSVNSIILPPMSFDNLPDNSMVETQVFLSMTRSIPCIRDAVKGLLAKVCLVAMIVDPFGSDVMDVAREFDIPPYLFFPSNAMNLAFSIMLPRLDKEVSCEFKDLLETVQIPGCVPVHGKDLMDPVQDRSNDAYKWILHHAKRFVLAEGILVNTFMELEKDALKHLQEKEPGKPPVYPVGPLIKTGPTIEERDECLKWLDNQPNDSVLLVSFGSGGTLSHNQLNELALGLESSGHKFLWVVRSPNDQSSNAAFFSVHSQDDPFGFLPKGFLERTKDQGLVVPSWAPQIEVLSHRATGGFLSHCGWNSTLESIVHGVPIVAWPLYAEQKMNAILLSEDLNVALRPKVSGGNGNGLVEREEIANVVKNLMEEGSEEGERVRNGMKRMKDAARKVLSHDGSSTEALAKLASQWRNQKSSKQV